jgi:cobalt-zinc-cadmium efflux system protein
MSTTETVLTAHLVMPGRAGDDAFLHRVAGELAAAFRIQHTTAQIEAGDAVHPCALAPESAV